MSNSIRLALRLIALCAFVPALLLCALAASSYIIEGPGGPGMGVFGRESAIWFFIMIFGPWFMFAGASFLASFFIPKEDKPIT